MKVRTLRKHVNSYPPQQEKNPGRKYDIPAHIAAPLIAAGLVADDSEAVEET